MRYTAKGAHSETLAQPHAPPIMKPGLLAPVIIPAFGRVRFEGCCELRPAYARVGNAASTQKQKQSVRREGQ